MVTKKLGKTLHTELKSLILEMLGQLSKLLPSNPQRAVQLQLTALKILFPSLYPICSKQQPVCFHLETFRV